MILILVGDFDLCLLVYLIWIFGILEDYEFFECCELLVVNGYVEVRCILIIWLFGEGVMLYWIYLELDDVDLDVMVLFQVYMNDVLYVDLCVCCGFIYGLLIDCQVFVNQGFFSFDVDVECSDLFVIEVVLCELFGGICQYGLDLGCFKWV